MGKALVGFERIFGERNVFVPIVSTERSQLDIHHTSEPLGGAAAAGRRRHRGDDGARLAAIGAGELRGHRQQAALKDQRFRGARSSSLSIDLRARGRQRDPLGPPQARRRRFHFRSIRFGAAAIAASVSGATGSGRLGGAGQLLADVAIGASDGAPGACGDRRRGELRGHRQQAALKEQRFRDASAEKWLLYSCLRLRQPLAYYRERNDACGD